MAESLCLQVHFRDRYRILCTQGDSDLVKATTCHLESGRQAVERLFQTQVEFLFLNVFLCPSRSVLDRFVESITSTPTSNNRIGQPQGNDIYMLSPKAYRSDAPLFGREEPPYYDEAEFGRNVMHELVHVWEELTSPRAAMDLRPGWFSEGLAMYVSGSNREKSLASRLSNDYERGLAPHPSEISGDKNYTWGCVLFEFLLQTFGPDRILALIENTATQDVLSELTPNKEDLIDDYLVYARRRARGLSSTGEPT